MDVQEEFEIESYPCACGHCTECGLNFLRARLVAGQPKTASRGHWKSSSSTTAGDGNYDGSAGHRAVR